MPHRLLRAAATSAFTLAVLSPAAGAAAPPRPFHVPPGYRLVMGERLAHGVAHYRLVSASPKHVVEVGIVRKGTEYRVETRHAGARSAGPDRRLERSSSMCDGCAYGTNGDYDTRRHGQVVARPIGGLVERGVVLVSPSEVHQQASYTYDGGFTTQRLSWSGTAAAGEKVLTIFGKNIPRGHNRVVLYTSDYVASTGTNDHGAELTLRLADGATNLPPNAPTTATMLAFRYGRGNSPVRPGTVVLSGHLNNAERLRTMWKAGGRGTTVVLSETLSPPNVWASVGGGHILMRDGKRWFQRENAPHLTASHPRTFAGVTKGGDLFHVTVDGRERNAGRSVGMPLEEALRFFTAFGAREVINMDGGGSTTFVRRGKVVNRPSDGVERVVSTAIVVVPGRIPRLPVVPRVPGPRGHRPEVPVFELAAAPAAPSVPVEKPLAAFLATGNVVFLGLSVWARRRRLPDAAP